MVLWPLLRAETQIQWHGVKLKKGEQQRVKVSRKFWGQNGKVQGIWGLHFNVRKEGGSLLSIFVLELIYTVTQLWFWTSIALFLCGPSSMNILESLLAYVLCIQDMNQRNPALSVPLKLQTVFLYPLARYIEFTKLFSNHIYGEIFPWRIKYMSLRHSQGSVLCNSSCYRLVYFWGRLR